MGQAWEGYAQTEAEKQRGARSTEKSEGNMVPTWQGHHVYVKEPI